MGEGWELKTIGPLPHLSLNYIHSNFACNFSTETGALPLSLLILYIITIL